MEPHGHGSLQAAPQVRPGPVRTLRVREPRLPQVHGLPVDVDGMLTRMKAPVNAVGREVVAK